MSGTGVVMSNEISFKPIDDATRDLLIERFSAEGQPKMLRLAASLMSQMIDGEIKEGERMPVNLVLMNRDGATVSNATSAKQLLFALGLTSRDHVGYISRVTPRSRAEQAGAA
jgi:hypothetical protein